VLMESKTGKQEIGRGKCVEAEANTFPTRTGKQKTGGGTNPFGERREIREGRKGTPLKRVENIFQFGSHGHN